MSLAVPVLIAFALWALLGGKAEAREVPTPSKKPLEPPPGGNGGEPPGGNGGEPPGGNGGEPPEIVGDVVTPELCWTAAYEVAATGNVDAMRQVLDGMGPICSEAAEYLMGAIDQVLADCRGRLGEAAGTNDPNVLENVANELDSRGCHQEAGEARSIAAQIRQQLRETCDAMAADAMNSGDPGYMRQMAYQIQGQCPGQARVLLATADDIESQGWFP